MTHGVALAVSGSNVTGDVPFSCALDLPSGLVEARSPAGERGELAALVAQLCATHGVRPEQVSELRLDLGPGSYTGLRVAVTFVRFLQRFGEVPVFAVDSLTLLAAAAVGEPGRLRPLLDARRGRYHLGMLAWQGPHLARLAEPRAVPFSEVLASTAQGDVFVVPASVDSQVGAELRAAGARLKVASEVTARQLFGPAVPLARCASAELEPRYLMGSYAED